MTTTRRAVTQGLVSAAALASTPLLAQTRASAQGASKSLAPRAVWPGGVQKPLMPYTPAIKAGGWLFVAGQLASDFKTGIDPSARRCELAMLSGATHTFAMTAEEARVEVAKVTREEMLDVVFEVTGHPAVLARHPGGELPPVGQHPQHLAIGGEHHRRHRPDLPRRGQHLGSGCRAGRASPCGRWPWRGAP